MAEVDIIIPVYNRVEMLHRAVSSVLSQTFSSFELTVVDDGSTEDLSAIKGTIEEAEHRFLRIEHSGVATARNIGVGEGSAPWVAFLDSDDEWFPEKLERQIEFHKENPNIRISQCEEHWNRNGRRVNKHHKHRQARGDAFEQSLELCCISPSSVLIERKLFEEHRGFDSQFRVCEDYDLWVRITQQESVGFISDPLVMKYGGHSDQLSRSEKAIDRFRLFSLLKLFLHTALTEPQELLVVKAIQKKAEILLRGSEKRDSAYKKFYQDLYRQSGEYFKNNSYREPFLRSVETLFAQKDFLKPLEE